MSASNPNLNDIFTDIANAIREKKGTSEIIYPINFADEITTITGGGDQPQLFAPAISISGRTLTVSDSNNGSFLPSYSIYANNSLAVTINAPGQVDLSTYISTPGSHSVTARSVKENFNDSDMSASVLYGVYSISASITDGTYSGDNIIISGETATITIMPDADKQIRPENLSVVNARISSFNWNTGVLIITNPTGNVTINAVCTETPSVDPILDYNSWEVIKQICQLGQAENYWALGDSKNITISGVGDVPHAIVDMSPDRYEYTNGGGVYTNVVFQAVPVIGSYRVNRSSSGAYNGWGSSELRYSMQNAGTIFRMYDASFTALLEKVKTMAAYDGLTNTLTYSSDLLFIPAIREVISNPSNIQSCESSISEYGFYAQNADADANRIKYPIGSSSADNWWTRSPVANNNKYGFQINTTGSKYSNFVTVDEGIAPCFAW